MATEAVLYVRDLEAMTAFYRQCIGLPAVETGDGYCGLQADALILWLVRGQHVPGADTHRAAPARRRSDAPVKLAFDVGSVERAARSIVACGGSIAPSTWDFAGYRRCDAVDPEGNVIQLLEPLATSR